ncbi:Haze protective factor 1 [Streptomyces sp. BA2]|uniref:Haze protective factor 1 n=1 Tax=Streptomyces sp. BA2 TaxID=436595 RepID=UPI001326061F|nr:Haze protective factor 1 [Streptomyces sp. BA2]MWA15037.1 Haze protective factor 1 [Streptomyces sp. BA2]
MPENADQQLSGIVTIDRSIFGLDQSRRPGEDDDPYWTDLPLDSKAAVHVEKGAALIISNAQSHEAAVTLKVQDSTTGDAYPGFQLLGNWPFLSRSGDVSLLNIDGPELTFNLDPDSSYTLQVWRKGGETASTRFNELMGNEHPITGLENYRLVFTRQTP